MSEVIEAPAVTPSDDRVELDPDVCEKRSLRLRRRLERLIGIAATEGNS
ncbi:cardiolipin synthase B, partial [Streptomyces cyaneofuscatus]